MTIPDESEIITYNYNHLKIAWVMQISSIDCWWYSKAQINVRVIKNENILMLEMITYYI